MENAAWAIQKPSEGDYKADVLALEERPLLPIKDGEVRVKLAYISLDPSNLMWLKLLPGWMEKVNIGDIMKGPSVAFVEASKAEGFQVGDLVSGPINWSTRANISANLLTLLNKDDNKPITTHLSIFSHVGRAAMLGMRYVGKIQAGETVLVSGAAGATGSLACQIAKAQGCTVIGIAGGKEKCRWLMETLGIDAVIDYKNDNVVNRLVELCPEGPNVFFDNIGGELLDSLLPHLAINGRIAVCGQISQYGDGGGYQFNNLGYFLMRRLTMQGYVVPDFINEYEQIDAALNELYQQQLLKDRPHILPGLATASEGLEMLLSGANDGKLLVKVDPDL